LRRKYPLCIEIGERSFPRTGNKVQEFKRALLDGSRGRELGEESGLARETAEHAAACAEFGQ